MINRLELYEFFMGQLKNYFKYRPFKSKKILLVDDEVELCWIMEKIMRDAGHRLFWATTAREGMEKFKRLKHLDVAMIDLKINHTNGLVFIRKARKINDKVRFVVLTAFGTPYAKKQARGMGVNYFLDKPVRIERLLDIIDRDCF